MNALRVFVLSVCLSAMAGMPAHAREFDLILRNGTVIDGTGAARRKADVGIIGDSIAAVGNLAGSTGRREIQLDGLVLTPGFIDMHAHVAENEYGDSGLLSKDVRRRAAQNYVMQGVTSAAANPDGYQPASLIEQRERLTRAGIGMNVALFNGHNSMRATVMGKDTSRLATPAEVTAMQELLRRGMEKERSFGLSLGLEYDSGRYSDADEVVALASAMAPYGGVYIAHQRSQGSAPMWYKPSRSGGLAPPTLAGALAESVRVAEEGGVTVVVTHIKGWGPGFRGEAAKTIATLQAARDRGARIFMDLYPYFSAGSDGSFVMLPPWAIGADRAFDADGMPRRNFDHAAALRRVLRDSSKRAGLAADIANQVALKGGAEHVTVLSYRDHSYDGKTIADLMRLRGQDLTGLAIALQLEGDRHEAGGVKLRAVSMDPRDIELFYSQSWAATGSDGWIVLPEEAVGPLKYVETNQRNFGTYPRRLGFISLERKVDTLEEAVRKSSGLPAQILGLRDRGVIATGMKADLAAIDLAKLRDNTTIAEPSVYPSGVQHVFVNGVAVVADGRPTLALPGRVLDPPGR